MQGHGDPRRREKDGTPKFTKLSTKIDRSVFPRLQGGPKGDMLAARGVLFYELLQPEFKEYAKQVCRNAKALAKGCADEGMRIITGGTDTHMVMIDVTPGSQRPGGGDPAQQPGTGDQ